MKGAEEMGDLLRYWESIPAGKENAVTYPELERLWGMSARRVRLMLAELSSFDNGDNFILIRSSASKGFYLSDDPDEIKAYKRECRSRALKTFAPLKKVNRVLADIQPDCINYSFVNNMRLVRLSRQMTQDSVCKLMRAVDPSFDKSKLSRLENSYALPTPQQLRALSIIYSCEPSALVVSDDGGFDIFTA